MPTVFHIKPGRLTLSEAKQLPVWSVTWGGPLEISPEVIEVFYRHAELLHTDGLLLPVVADFFRQVFCVLHQHPDIGIVDVDQAELVGFCLSAGGESGDLFLGVAQGAGNALRLLAPADLEGAE